MPHPVSITRLQQAAARLEARVGFLLSPTALFFAAAAPAQAFVPGTESWTCMFALMKKIQAGGSAAFSAAAPGCLGASCYLGFNDLPVAPAAFYLSKMERLKKDVSLAAAFYQDVQPLLAASKYLVFQRLDKVDIRVEVDIVNLWVDASSLSNLHALANYDRDDNQSVIMPFASGCQSIWTLPFKEKQRPQARAVVGSLDPTVRAYLPPGAVSFSIPAGRFLEMCDNVPGSFLSH
ncbi:MAG: DUF169 domain-containing protein [Thermoleophilia bacterium]